MSRKLVADQDFETELAARLQREGIPACPLCRDGFNLPPRRKGKKAKPETPYEHALAHLGAGGRGKPEEPFDVWIQIAVMEDVQIVPDEMGTRFGPLDDLHDDPVSELVRDFLCGNAEEALAAGFFIERRLWRNADLGYTRECVFADKNLWHLLLTLSAATMPQHHKPDTHASTRWRKAFTMQALELFAETKRALAAPPADEIKPA